nr:response regulator transcription factor [Bacteriovorax sp. HI3]
MANKKILICDDHPIIHAGIKYTLKELFPEVQFDIDCATSGNEALLKIEDCPPEIFFLDLSLPDISGLELLKVLEKKNHQFKVIILTGETNLPVFLQLSRYKISAILLKSYNNDSFRKAFLQLDTNDDTIFLDAELEQGLQKEMNKKQLSAKEFEVLNLLVKGYSNKIIAQKLECSPETVKTHLTSISRKTSIDNRDDLVTWFYEGK